MKGKKKEGKEKLSLKGKGKFLCAWYPISEKFDGVHKPYHCFLKGLGHI